MFLFVLYRNRNGTWYETKEKRKQFERWIEVIDEDVIKSQQNLGNVWFWSSLIDTEIEHDNFDRFVENGWMYEMNKRLKGIDDNRSDWIRWICLRHRNIDARSDRIKKIKQQNYSTD